MDTLELYKIIDKEKIDISNFKWANTKARIFEINNKYYIGLDIDQINNSIEEKEILAEELGHYYTGSLYNSSMPFETISRCENRANKWAYSVLIPYENLCRAILRRN